MPVHSKKQEWEDKWGYRIDQNLQDCEHEVAMLARLLTPVLLPPVCLECISTWGFLQAQTNKFTKYSNNNLKNKIARDGLISSNFGLQ